MTKQQQHKRGRVSIFRDKADGVRVQGVLTKKGGKAFERRRAELAKLHYHMMGVRPTVISDADVIEFLARGEWETRGYLGDERERLEQRKRKQ
jgi:hypothetical protein